MEVRGMHILFISLPPKRLRQRLVGLALAAILALLTLLSVEGVKKIVPAAGSGDNPLFQVATNKSIAALAINVAWGEKHLPELLAALAEGKVKASFFMVGEWAQRFPDLTREMAQQGHELGNHSFTHPYPTQISVEELVAEIENTARVVQDLTGQTSNLFAPPYGQWNDNVVLTAGELGYRTIMWTIDSIDWQQPGVEVITSRVLDNLAPGSIILMHPTEQTVKALPQIMAGAREQGFKFITVSELIAEGSP